MADFDTATRNSLCTSLETIWGTAIRVKIYTGSKPGATTDAATGNLIGDVQLTSDWMGTPSGGVAPIGATADFTVLTPGGTPGYVRIYKSDNTTCVWQEAIGASVTVTPSTLTTGAPARIGTLNIRF